MAAHFLSACCTRGVRTWVVGGRMVSCPRPPEFGANISYELLTVIVAVDCSPG